MANEDVLRVFVTAATLSSHDDVCVARALLSCTCRALRDSVCFISDETGVRVLERFLDLAREAAVSRREAVILSAGASADEPALAACYDVYGRYFHIVFSSKGCDSMVVHDTGGGDKRQQLRACVSPRSPSGSTSRSRHIRSIMRVAAVHGRFTFENMCAVELGTMRCRDIPLSRRCTPTSPGQPLGLGEVLLMYN